MGRLSGLAQPENLHFQQVPRKCRLLGWGSAVTTSQQEESSQWLRSRI